MTYKNATRQIAFPIYSFASIVNIGHKENSN